MKVKILNMHLKKVAEFIASLELSSKASRGKVKFGIMTYMVKHMDDAEGFERLEF